jgi:hypothetical protein
MLVGAHVLAAGSVFHIVSLFLQFGVPQKANTSAALNEEK